MLGWTFGLADATLTTIDLLIFAPWLMNYLGWTAIGAATVAYASATVLAQFFGYAMHGPHTYTQDVKTIHYGSAQAEARRQLAAKNKDPDNPRNEIELNRLTEEELEKRFKAVGLPGQEEFFFDPLTIWQRLLKSLGYSADRLKNLTEEERKQLSGQDFILGHRHLGLIEPALKNALAEAERIQTESPSTVGAQTVQLLKWAIQNRGLAKPIAGRTWDAATSKWGYAGLKESVERSVADWMGKDTSVNAIGKYWAITRGMFNYLAKDSTQMERDIRSVLYAMSTNNSDTAFGLLDYLPNSWVEKAGSRVAANLGAELFHRHFIGYIEKEIKMVNSTEDVDSSVAARADAILASVPSTDLFHNQDPFERHVRRNMIISKIKSNDAIEKAINEWKPKKDDILGRYQLRKALRKAEAKMPSMDEAISEQWIAVAEAYAKDLTPSAQKTFEAKTWIREQQFNFLFAQAFLKTVGLHARNVEDSDFVPKVLARTFKAAEDQMQGGRGAWYAKLSETEKKVYYAKVFTEQFKNIYVLMSVNADPDVYLRASDPQFPGRLQRVRGWLHGKRFSWLPDRLTRVAEMFGRNEADAYNPGIRSFLTRNVPFVPDLVHNFIRTMRYLPYSAGPGYLTQKYVFQIHFPWVMWIVSHVLGSTNGAFVEINNRRARFFDSKPMGGIPEKLTFARVHALFTNPQAVGELMYADPIVKGFNQRFDSAWAKCEDLLKGQLDVQVVSARKQKRSKARFRRQKLRC